MLLLKGRHSASLLASLLATLARQQQQANLNVTSFSPTLSESRGSCAILVLPLLHLGKIKPAQ